MMSPGPLTKLDAVFFDVDGTLIDSLPMILPGLSETFAHFTGRQIPLEIIQGMIGMPLSQQLGAFDPQPLSDAEAAERTQFTIQAYAKRKHLVKLFEPAVEALIAFHRAGLKTALITSKNTQEYNDFSAWFPAMHAVDYSVCAGDVSRPKPDPESATKACAALGVMPERTLFIGDSIFDLRCARAAGCKSAAVTYGAAPYQTLIAEQPDFVFETPEAVLQWTNQRLSAFSILTS